MIKKARLTPEWQGNMIIRDDMTKQKKEVITKILYNRKNMLAWDFTEIKKVKREVTLPQKIRIVDYKAWQVLGF